MVVSTTSFPPLTPNGLLCEDGLIEPIAKYLSPSAATAESFTFFAKVQEKMFQHQALVLMTRGILIIESKAVFLPQLLLPPAAGQQQLIQLTDNRGNFAFADITQQTPFPVSSVEKCAIPVSIYRFRSFNAFTRPLFGGFGKLLKARFFASIR